MPRPEVGTEPPNVNSATTRAKGKAIDLASLRLDRARQQAPSTWP
jgi:hypothetical protein